MSYINGNIESKNIFEKIDIKNHRNFIETGTYLGNGIRWGLKYFDKVISIEILDEYYNGAEKNFKGEDKLTLIKGDSGVVLGDILESTEGPSFIFLDAHGAIDVQGPNPLYKELSLIKNHKIKNHIIAIDDVRRIGDKSDPCWSKVDLDELKSKLKEINSEYNVFVYKDLLIAALNENLDSQWWEND